MVIARPPQPAAGERPSLEPGWWKTPAGRRYALQAAPDDPALRPFSVGLGGALGVFVMSLWGWDAWPAAVALVAAGYISTLPRRTGVTTSRVLLVAVIFAIVRAARY